MLALLLGTLVVTTRGIDLADYQCTTVADCDGLKALIDSQAGMLASQITTVCNTVDGFCSIDCSGYNDICTAAESIVAGLTCDTDNGWCTADLSCDVNNGNADCTVTGFSTCSSVNRCIPDTTNECVQESDCTTDGIKNCDTFTIQGADVKICQVEPCDAANNLGQTTGCITTNYICGPKNVCVAECTPGDNSLCNDPIDLGGICTDDKYCIFPTAEPSKNPTSPPSKAPTKLPTANPTNDDGTPGDPGSDVGRYGVLGGFMIMLGMVLRM